MDFVFVFEAIQGLTIDCTVTINKLLSVIRVFGMILSPFIRLILIKRFVITVR